MAEAETRPFRLPPGLSEVFYDPQYLEPITVLDKKDKPDTYVRHAKIKTREAARTKWLQQSEEERREAATRIARLQCSVIQREESIRKAARYERCHKATIVVLLIVIIALGVFCVVLVRKLQTHVYPNQTSVSELSQSIRDLLDSADSEAPAQ